MGGRGIWRTPLTPLGLLDSLCRTWPRKHSLRSKRFCLAKKPRGTGFSFLTAREIKWEPKNERGKRGRGRKEGNACRQTPRFWKLAFASERSGWLARLVEQYWNVSIKVFFHTDRSCMVRDKHLPAVVVYSSRQDLPSNATAFNFLNFFWNSKFFLWLYKGFRSFNLFSKVSPGSE